MVQKFLACPIPLDHHPSRIEQSRMLHRWGEGSDPVLEVGETFPQAKQFSHSWGSAQCLVRKKRFCKVTAGCSQQTPLLDPITAAQLLPQSEPLTWAANTRSAPSLGRCGWILPADSAPLCPSARCYVGSPSCLCHSGFRIPVWGYDPILPGEGSLQPISLGPFSHRTCSSRAPSF